MLSTTIIMVLPAGAKKTDRYEGKVAGEFQQRKEGNRDTKRKSGPHDSAAGFAWTHPSSGELCWSQGKQQAAASVSASLTTLKPKITMCAGIHAHTQANTPRPGTDGRNPAVLSSAQRRKIRLQQSGANRRRKRHQRPRWPDRTWETGNLTATSKFQPLWFDRYKDHLSSWLWSVSKTEKRC